MNLIGFHAARSLLCSRTPQFELCVPGLTCKPSDSYPALSELLCCSSKLSIPAKQTSFMAVWQRGPEFEHLPETARLGIAESNSNRNERCHQRYRQPVYGGLDG